MYQSHFEFKNGYLYHINLFKHQIPQVGTFYQNTQTGDLFGPPHETVKWNVLTS